MKPLRSFPPRPRAFRPTPVYPVLAVAVVAAALAGGCRSPALAGDVAPAFDPAEAGAPKTSLPAPPPKSSQPDAVPATAGEPPAPYAPKAASSR